MGIKERQVRDREAVSRAILDAARELFVAEGFQNVSIRKIAERIARSEKTVLFINRRGSARFVLCRACGHVPECPRCSVSLHRARTKGSRSSSPRRLRW